MLSHLFMPCASFLEVSTQCPVNVVLRVKIVLKMAGAFKKFLPMFDRVLVERFAAELKTKGGIMIPDKSAGKVLEATVVAVGPGNRDKVNNAFGGHIGAIGNESGNMLPTSVKSGDRVLLPEYGGTKVVLEDKDYFLFRDSDILGKFE